jgi:glutamine amidotransferase
VTIAIFDYGAGNLHSLAKVIALVAEPPVVETDPRRAARADVLVLPGVGAFPPAAARLAPGRADIRSAIRDGLPCLGICLGMQLLFDSSDEGPGDGLGVIPGPVTRLAAPRLPQIGWNVLDEVVDPALLASGIRYGYYANSFACRAVALGVETAWSVYGGDRFPAAVRVARTLGVQFHPEKSSGDGVALVKAFLEEARR